MDKKTIRKRKRGFISFLLSLVLAVQCFAVNTGATLYEFGSIVEDNILQNGDTLDTSTKIIYYKGTTEYNSETGSSTINGAEYQKWKVTYIYKSAGSEEMHLIGIPTVSFDSQGGSAVAETVAEYDSTIAAPTAPTKDNCTFGGWYKEADCINAWNFSSDKVTVDVTLYAKWTPKEYTVTLNTKGGTINGDTLTSYTYGTGATLPTDVTKTGHTFGGWFDNEKLTGNAVTSISATATGNKQFWAKWTPINYTITWKNYDGSTLRTDTVPYGKTPSYGATDPTRPETAEYTYTFSGWDPAVAQVTGDAVYTAQYTDEGKTYSVTLNTKGGTINGDTLTSYTYGTGTTLPADVTKTGHTFGGWFDNEKLTGNAVTSISATATGNKTYWAKWTPINYTVTWKNYDNSTLKTDTVPYGKTPSYGATAPTRPETAEYTYTFAGWTPAVSSVTGDAVYTAQFTAEGKTYSVTFNTKGGTINSGNVPTEYTYGIGATLPTDVTKTGHTFGGWFDNEKLAGTKVTNIGTAETGNKTYWAKWTPINYTVTWKNYDNTTLRTDTVPYGKTPSYGATAPTRPETAEYTYTFSGWDPAVAQVTGDAVYTAQYTAEGKTYSVTFNSNGGNDVTPTHKNVKYGEAYGELPAPTRDGYDFVFWSTQETGGTQITDDSTVTTASDHTLYAQWNPKGGVAYKVLHYKQNVSGSGYYLADTDNLNGTAFSTVTPAVKQYTGFDSPATISATINYDGSTEVSYYYTRKTYTVVFDSDGGSQVPQQSVKYEANAEKPADPVKEGCTFAGWYIGETAFNFASPITGDTTLTAKWNAPKYTITFVNYDGTILQKSGFDYGAVPVYTGPVPTKAADAGYTYTFNGWDKEIVPVTGDAEYTAVFSKKGHYPPSVPVSHSVSKYTVTWINYDGTVLERDTGVPYGSYPSYDGALPTKEADVEYTYNFSGWTPDITYVTGDVTYTAKFSETALPVSPEENVPEEYVPDETDDIDSIETDDDNDESEDIIEDEQEDVIGYYVKVTPTSLSDSVFRLVMKEAGKNGKTAEKDLCWDIRLFRTVNGETEKQLHESKRPIKVEVSLTPEQIQLINEYDSFNIVRVHNGNLELLECVYDKQKGVLIFESDRFSDYALIHGPNEQEVTESDDNPGTGTADSTLCFAVLISAAVLILSRKRRA